MLRLVALLMFLVSGAARAETFRLLDGRVADGRVSGVYGDLLLIATKSGSFRVYVDELDDASLLKVAAFESGQPTRQQPWTASTSAVSKAALKRLQVLEANKLVAFTPGDRPEPEFYLVYFGAYWCGPCRRFSPRLLEAYHRMKATAPDRFDVIFVSDDENSAEHFKYVREVNMPWPLLRYGSNLTVFNRWRGRGIPCLVVLNREGDLLFHSYNGDEYLGADEPLGHFEKLLQFLEQPHTPSPRRHRLALARHLHGANGGERAPEAYLVQIDPRRNRTLPKAIITATVSIDDRGRPLDVSFAPALELVADAQLRREVENWLFLPAVRGGRFVPSTVNVPFNVTPPQS